MAIETTLPKLLQARTAARPELTAQASKNAEGVFQYYTFKDLYDSVLDLAAAFSDMGIKRGDRVGLISDNRREWLMSDFALLSLGAADVPRGCDSTGTEIRFILSFSECTFAIFENEHQFKKILEKRTEVPLLKTAILFDVPSAEILTLAADAGIAVHAFKDVMKRGTDAPRREAMEAEIEKGTGDELATIIFTSGTTGTPKGVMLTHRNYLSQLEDVGTVLDVHPGEMWLSVLPVWHSFERVVQYIALTLHSGLAYSKPVAAVMLPDMAAVKPQWMCGVPRLWESLAQGIFRSMKKTGGAKLALFNFFVSLGKVYMHAGDRVFNRVCTFKKEHRILDILRGIIPLIFLSPLYALGNALVFSKIKEKLGGRFRVGISGGGALQKDTDDFYQALGIRLLEGYGITEAAPVLSVRNSKKPRSGCVGVVFPSAEIKIVAEKEGIPLSAEPLPVNTHGLIMAWGDQIMKGYYRQPELTKQVIDSDGWLNTGDLGILSSRNEIKITGRAKDTIVLLGGENIEPAAIEAAINGSSFVEFTVVLGQDKKYLAALIVPAKDALTEWARANGLVYDDYSKLLTLP
ncbi:MAG: long-chain fatty acid--CoA ligase, partial [Spirochaetaceae bacterium]|nr:long-chain fatty acid--CoA ligase [Spirochaetaceae bacterium]